MSNLLNIGLSGLTAGRSGLDNTAQNVSNTLTEWYSRRENIHEATQTHGGGRILQSGVTVAEVRRVTNAFVTTRVWYTSGQYEQAKVMDSYVRQLDAILGGENTGYAQPLNQLHRSLQRAAVTPESLAVRQQVLGDANLAAVQLATLQERFNAFHDQMAVQVESIVVEVNEISESIANVNERIHTAELAGSDTGDLRDSRNRLVDRLSELIGAKLLDNQDGNIIEVILGGGEPLVTGSQSRSLSVKQTSRDEYGGYAATSSPDVDLDVREWSGVLGGIAKFHDILVREQKDLNEQARLLVEGTNHILAQGFGLDGSTGHKLFHDWGVDAGHVKVALEDPRKLGFAHADASDPSKSSGPGDSRNLLRLVDYFDGDGLDNSLSVMYDQQVSRVATEGRKATSREKAELSLRDSVRAERDNLSAVNLDEEAANLIRFQQYYQANVRVIAMGSVVIDELLDLF